ncbi:helix-turn-helix domain-containing protein [Clostridium butyricum]|uniref:helix-turn-helix domain-containing protein n=1 Tax=Clostridium butyricum TaxID=1492 RepID=UPI0009037346|nr:helix-turn-helix domain-containing protein [Clostridium butyricum]APF23989.1 helix-turn-helix domain protein [Clostridium butyricum]
MEETKIILDLNEDIEVGTNRLEKQQKKTLEAVTITSTPYSELTGGFHILPNDIYRAMTILGLKANEKLVYLYLIRLAHNSGLPFPSYDAIMNNTGINSRNTLANVLKSLEERNLIKRIYRGNSHGQANTYRVNYIKYSKTVEKIN